jgi:hypothetical protein
MPICGDMPELTRRIVTSTYSYKRPPRKKAKADPPPGPIIVTAKRGRRPPPENAPIAASVPEPKSSVVTATSRKQLKRMREERGLAAGADADPEVTARVRAFLKRMIRPPGE